MLVKWATEMSSLHILVLVVITAKFKALGDEELPSVASNQIPTDREEGPSQVRELRGRGYPTKIVLEWLQPQVKEEQIVEYDFKYTLKRRRECPQDTSGEEAGFSIDALYISQIISTNITDLKPYSLYELKVRPVTTTHLGEYSTILVNTSRFENIKAEGVPRVFSLQPSSNTVAIVLDNVECSGALKAAHVFLQATCNSKWCEKQNVKKQQLNESSETINLNNLYPYTNYSLFINASKDDIYWTDSSMLTFKTEPTVPPPVSEFKITSMDVQSIMLRWIPGYPPTGILKEYKLQFKCLSDPPGREYVFKPSTCRLWPNYHCATTIYSSHLLCTVQLLGRNEHSYVFEKLSKALPAYLKSYRTEPPYAVKVNWTEDNTLTVSWNHPNATKGVLTKFEIDIVYRNNDANRTLSKTYPIKSVDDYNLTYSCQIKQLEINYCSTYNMSIKAFNEGYNNESTNVEEVRPPPLPPAVSQEDVLIASTDRTITVEIPQLQFGINSSHYNKKVYLLISDRGSIEGADFEKFLHKRQDPALLKNSRLVYEGEQKDLPVIFVIGHAAGAELPNPPLDMGKEYHMDVFFVNECGEKIRLRRIYKRVYTTGSEDC